jgi:hypothetical protein
VPAALFVFSEHEDEFVNRSQNNIALNPLRFFTVAARHLHLSKAADEQTGLESIQVLNDDLPKTFCQLFPGIKNGAERHKGHDIKFQPRVVALSLLALLLCRPLFFARIWPSHDASSIT